MEFQYKYETRNQQKTEPKQNNNNIISEMKYNVVYMDVIRKKNNEIKKIADILNYNLKVMSDLQNDGLINLSKRQVFNATFLNFNKGRLIKYYLNNIYQNNSYKAFNFSELSDLINDDLYFLFQSKNRLKQINFNISRTINYLKKYSCFIIDYKNNSVKVNPEIFQKIGFEYSFCGNKDQYSNFKMLVNLEDAQNKIKDKNYQHENYKNFKVTPDILKQHYILYKKQNKENTKK